ncbi:MAG: pyridoxal phosphate-dependent aminotransferase [Lachnospiraceae bacterium]|nr:pyridoxal phosphate-dependent aminotransferase [Lachnospiraceae bacterium]
MKYDFDRVVNRVGTNCLKYDFAVERGKAQDVLPLWVADMDFPTAEPILERLHEAVSHGIFGYSEPKQSYFDAVSAWYKKYFHWELKRNWLVKTPGVVYALAVAVQTFTEPGDSVMIQQPVYYPFSEVIEDNKRKLVSNDLQLVNGHYEIDFVDFEKKIVENHVKLFLFCSPHNPVGRVWTKEELQRIGDICVKHDVLVVSDEIHADFTFPGYEHTVFATMSEEIAERTITCTAPSKTFNLAGMQVSNNWISNGTLRRKFRHGVAATGYSQLNSLGLVACEAAYKTGEEWLTQLKQYLVENLQFLQEYLERELPEIKLIPPEGTYLIWLDCRGLGLTPVELDDLVENKAKLWLDSGKIFGKVGEGFQRINIACPRATLEKAMEQWKNAIRNCL